MINMIDMFKGSPLLCKIARSIFESRDKKKLLLKLLLSRFRFSGLA